jgi:hypothetical protein
MTSQQDQNHAATDAGGLPSEATLVRDLRWIIEHGKNLRHRHFKKFEGFQDLNLVLRAANPDLSQASSATDSQQTDALTVEAILAAVETAINTCADKDPSADGQHDTMIRNMLFGLTPETEKLPTAERRQRALDYYNEHLAWRRREKHPVSDETFRGNVCGKEILPQIAEELLRLENELRRTANPWNVPLMGAAVAQRWERTFWWLFRLEDHILGLAANLALTMQQAGKSDVHDELNLNAAPITVRSSGDGTHLVLALYEVACIRRFGLGPQPSFSGTSSEVLMIAKYFLPMIDDFLSLTERDKKLLDQSLDASLRAGNSRNFLEYSSYFKDALQSDPQGQRLLKRSQSLIDLCECAPRADENQEDREENVCLLHQLIQACLGVRDQIESAWVRVGHYYALLDSGAHKPQQEDFLLP